MAAAMAAYAPRCKYGFNNDTTLSYLSVNNRVFAKNNNLSWC